jgi:hypothetical protein
MRSKLVNVRLQPGDAAKAEALKAHGIELSSLVREAIRSEHARALGNGHAKKSVKQILHDIYEQYPVPEGALPLPIDTTDRRAVQQFISQKLRIKHARIQAQWHAQRKRQP